MTDTTELKKELYTKLGWTIKYESESIPSDEENEFETVELPYLCDDTGSKKSDRFNTEEDLWADCPLVTRWILNSLFRRFGEDIEVIISYGSDTTFVELDYSSDYTEISESKESSGDDTDALLLAELVLEFLNKI